MPKPFKELFQKMLSERQAKIEKQVQLVMNDPYVEKYYEVIFSLVQDLSSVEGVKKVKAYATRFPDIHYVDFEIEGVASPSEAWSRIQDIIIDCEDSLRNESGDKWYFIAKTVSVFNDDSQLIAAS